MVNRRASRTLNPQSKNILSIPFILFIPAKIRFRCRTVDPVPTLPYHPGITTAPPVEATPPVALA